MMDWRGGFELSFAPSRMFSQSSTTQLITLLLHVLVLIVIDSVVLTSISDARQQAHGSFCCKYDG